jgi:mRNA-degrading endonuclease toxin of MazEF toxin-antitoxin module
MAGRLNRGDVHLWNFAPPDKQRPVLILTRDSAVGHLSSVTVAAISSRYATCLRKSPWEFPTE